MKAWQRYPLWGFSVFGLLSLTGCWDQRSVTDRSMATVLDVVPTSKPGIFAWTYRFPNVAVTVSSLPSIKPSEQYYAYTVNAASLAQSQTRVQHDLSRDLYMGQLKIVAWSSTMTTEQVTTLVNTLNHEGITPHTYWVVIGTPPLAKLFVVSPQQAVPELYLSHFFNCRQCQPFKLGCHGWQFWAQTVTPGISPVAPYATNSMHISQVAVYGQSGRPHILTVHQTQGWAYLTDRAEKATLTLPTRQGIATLSRIHGTRSQQVRLVHGVLRVTEKLKLTGMMSQIPAGAVISQEYLSHIQRLAEHAVRSRCLGALRVANRTHTDPFGYARTLLWTNNEATRGMPLSQLATLPIDATVTVRLKIVGQGVSV